MIDWGNITLIKTKKVQFSPNLGFVINSKGIQPDPKKVEVIKSLQQPTTVKQVCSIIGACSYYHRFIPNFSGIAEPIIKLTRKYAKFHWTPECDKAFQFWKIKTCSTIFLDNKILIIISIPLSDQSDVNEIYHAHNLPLPLQRHGTNNDVYDIVTQYQIEANALAILKTDFTFRVTNFVFCPITPRPVCIILY